MSNRGNGALDRLQSSANFNLKIRSCVRLCGKNGSLTGYAGTNVSHRVYKLFKMSLNASKPGACIYVHMCTCKKPDYRDSRITAPGKPGSLQNLVHELRKKALLGF